MTTEEKDFSRNLSMNVDCRRGLFYIIIYHILMFPRGKLIRSCLESWPPGSSKYAAARRRAGLLDFIHRLHAFMGAPASAATRGHRRHPSSQIVPLKQVDSSGTPGTRL